MPATNTRTETTSRLAIVPSAPEAPAARTFTARIAQVIPFPVRRPDPQPPRPAAIAVTTIFHWG